MCLLSYRIFLFHMKMNLGKHFVKMHTGQHANFKLCLKSTCTSKRYENVQRILSTSKDQFNSSLIFILLQKTCGCCLISWLWVEHSCCTVTCHRRGKRVQHFSICPGLSRMPSAKNRMLQTQSAVTCTQNIGHLYSIQIQDGLPRTDYFWCCTGLTQ